MSRAVCGICWCPYDDDGKCGCKPAQPEALRISDQLDDAGIPAWMAVEAAAELRRLHVQNTELQDNLEKKSISIQRIWKERDELRTELQATERQVEILTDALAQSRKADEALLRQALEALESCDAEHPSDGYRQWYDSKDVATAIAAINERLK